MGRREQAIEELAQPETTPETPAIQGTPQAPAMPAQTAQEKIEELEIALNGKPIRIPTNEEFPIKHNGQIIKQPLSGLMNSFRQSQHIEDKLKEYRTLKEQIEKDRGDLNTFTEQKKKYGALQEWSEKNPEEFERIWQMYQDKDKLILQNQMGTPQTDTSQSYQPLMDKIAALSKELMDMKQWRGTLESEQMERHVATETENLKKEIEEFKGQWPEVNLDEKNLDGLSLRSIIMNHGLAKDITNFRLAALDYLGPRLLEIAQERGRNEAVKNVQKDRQQGVISRSSTPSMGQGEAGINPKMSKQERLEAAKAELEALRSQVQ